MMAAMEYVSPKTNVLMNIITVEMVRASNTKRVLTATMMAAKANVF